MSNELAELKTRHARLILLRELSRAAGDAPTSAAALDLLLRAAVKETRADAGFIALMNPNTGYLEVEAAFGLPVGTGELRLRVSEGVAGWVTRSGRPARVEDVRKDPRYFALRKSTRAELAVPLDVGEQARGVFCVMADRVAAFSAAEEEWLFALADEVARLIRRSWSFEQLQLKARLFETLASVSQAIHSALNLDDALRVITREARGLMQAKMCSLMLLDGTREWLDLRASAGAGPAYLNKPRLSTDESLLGVVVRRRKPLQIANVQTSGRYQNVAVAREEGLVALLSVPLALAGEAVGALSVYKGEPHVFSNEEVSILSAFAELSALAIGRARLYERVVDVEEQLRQNEKLSALGLLAAEVAHEIRNPLTVMKMLYHSLDLRFPVGDPRAKDAEILGQKIEHLNRIVERILVLARSGEPKSEPVNVNQLLDELGLLVRHKLKQQNVELVRKLDPALPALSGNATQLEQAFLNLTLNAVEAMPQGGTLTIATRALVTAERASGILPESQDGSAGWKPAARSVAVAARHIVIEFTDTGEGMTEAQRRQVFSSVLQTTKRKGTGLGLAIVQRVVAAHGGKIEIKSRRGRGTVVSLTLPVSVQNA
ncbi:MAG TPA: GAF domain-containing protein [Verrucomicrobiae bacterium]